MCKNLPHILLCTLDYKEDKLNSKYTWTHFRRKALFQKPPNNFSYFQPELHCITCIHQQFGKEEETTMMSQKMVPTLRKLSELHGDILGCHEGWGPLLAFSGWEPGRPNVLESIWLFHMRKCCPKCQQRENRWKNNNYKKTRGMANQYANISVCYRDSQ